MFLDILPTEHLPDFDARLRTTGMDALHALQVTTLQVNLGKRCNQACHHCHVDAGPQRTEEMSFETLAMVLDIMRRQRFEVLDITGGAPEINAVFRPLVREARKLTARIIDRCNLTILLEPGHEDLGAFLATQGVVVTASLPCYELENVDKQRGQGVFAKSIEALKRLNALGYGRANSGLELNLVYNPVGAHLPPPQADLEMQYRTELRRRFGIEFSTLQTITNMPISRFMHDLRRSGQLGPYYDKLHEAFNAATLPGLMCRQLISVGYDGRLYDCDFNQMTELPVSTTSVGHISQFDIQILEKRRIQTAAHCLGCTAGAGSSCSGAVLR